MAVNIDPGKWLKLHYEGLMNSYAQVFFTKNRIASVIFIIATFIDTDLGIWGLAGILFTNLVAHILGFSTEHIREGLYGFNSLLVVLGLAAYFSTNPAFLLIFFASCILTLFISIAALYYLSRLNLPFISLPFLITVWIMLLAVRQYSAIEPDTGSIYFINYLYSIGGKGLLNIYELLNNIAIPDVIAVFFKSLSAIVFQYNLLAGIMIAAGILISSRISFSLAILGYLAGYGFYQWVGADITQLHYSYLGFNFILTAIALGAFFFIPSWKTYLLVFGLTPIIGMLTAAASTVMQPLLLPVFSLPFAIIVLIVLYITNFNDQKISFARVIYQHYSPERNLYSWRNYFMRFTDSLYTRIALPFFGDWHISQAHDGKDTHKEDWKHAWDFDIVDKEGRPYSGSGNLVEDYFCYNLPVLAPAEGYITDLIDKTPDNSIGKANLKNNWGNAVVIRHTEELYSKVSHLRPGSVNVKRGDYVKKGDVLGYAGNSGRSPYPHLHFQLQSTPYIGSRTLEYPLAYYMLKSGDKKEFRSFSIPEKDDLVSNIKTEPLLTKAFEFIPGKLMKMEYEDYNGNIQKVKWETFTNALNQTYIYCHSSKSSAYLVNDDTMHYFTHFEGDKESLLYLSYLAAYKVLLGFYRGLSINDQIPLDQLYSGGFRLIEDFIAPFSTIHKAIYRVSYEYIDSDMRPQEIIIKSTAILLRGKKEVKKLTFEIKLQQDRIYTLKAITEKGEITATNIQTIMYGNIQV